MHVVATSHDLVGLALQPASLVGAQSSHILRDMLQRGFTAVRDVASAAPPTPSTARSSASKNCERRWKKPKPPTCMPWPTPIHPAP